MSTPSSPFDSAEAPLGAETLTSLVRGVDGVTDIYPPAATISQLPQVAAALATGDLDRLNRVVSSGTDEMDFRARIATDIDLAAPEVAARVADVLLSQIPEGASATIDVQVSRIA